MAEAVLRLGLDPTEFNSKLDDAEARVRRLKDDVADLPRSLPGGSSPPRSGGDGPLQRAEREALKLAQAQARLAVSSGSLTNAQSVLERALATVNQETLHALRAQNQLAQVQARLQRESEGVTTAFVRVRHSVAGIGPAAAGSSRIAREAFITASSEIIESWGVDGDIANELGKMFYNLPVQAKLAIAGVVGGFVVAGAAVAAVIVTTNEMLDVAKRVGTESKEDFDKLARSIKDAGFEVTALDRVMSQDLTKAADEVKAATDGLFLVLIRESGPELIQLLKNTTKFLNELGPAATVFGDNLAIAFVGASAALTTFGSNAGKTFKALLSLLSTNPLQVQKGITDLFNLDAAFKDELIKTYAEIEQIRKKAREDAEKGFRGFKGNGDAIAQARQVREARLGEVRSGLQDELKLYLDFAKEQQSTLESSYRQDLVSTREYLENRQLLTEASIEKAIAVRDREIAAIRQALEAVKVGTPEEIRLRKELNEVYAKSALQVADLTEQLQKKISTDQVALVIDQKRLEIAREQFNLTQNLKATGEKFLSGQEEVIDPRIFRGEQARTLFNARDLELQREEINIRNQVNQGLLNEAEGRRAILSVQRASRDELIQFLELQKQGEFAKGALGSVEVVERLNVQIEQLRTLGQELTPAQAFFTGLRDESRTLADSLRDAGRTLKSDFIDLFDQGIGKLTSRFGVFGNTIRRVLNDLIGFAFNDFIRAVFGVGGNGSSNGAASSAGSGGIRGIIQQTLGGVFNRNGNGNSIGIGPGGTAVFNPNSFAGSASTGVSGAVRSALSGLSLNNLSVPDSITGRLQNVEIGSSGGATGGGLGGILSGLGLGNLGGLFKGIGFGLPTGASRGALAGALPLLGLTLGAGLGGSSVLGQILGGVGGGLLGVGLTAAPAALAGGSFGFLAPLFSNPFTAIAGAAALAGALLLGRAKQRRTDEATSGDSLQRAIDQLKDLKRQADRGELTSIREAESSFTDIHRQFINETLQLKTKSVRESRLNNQGDITPPLHPDSLRALFERETLPAVIAANQRKGVFDKLIPEFATGGIVPRTGPIYAHERELILNLTQQRSIAGMAGADVFTRAGVPNAPTVAPAPTVYTATSRANAGPPQINLSVQLGVSRNDAQEIFITGAETSQGERVIVNLVNDAKQNGEIK